MAASPTSATTIERIYSQTDICEILPAIHVPTLVLHPSSDQHEDVEGARFIADHVPGARLVEVAGADAYPWGDNADVVLAEIEEFLTGMRPVVDPDRVLSTVVFTDIVGSTDLVVTMGDRAWRDVLERHQDDVRRLLSEFRGREIDTAGDGFFATFDGPARAVRCAEGIAASAVAIGLQVRAGVHTGEVELSGEGVRGIAVHVGARVAAAAGPSEVLVSATVKDLTAGSGLVFESAGEHELKGVPGDWHLYRVVREPS
jgi:class 3 adenylate cyclase